MRVLLAHDYLAQRGGAERVALSLARSFPGAPLYTSLYAPAQTFPEFGEVDVRTLPLQRIRPLRRDPRLAVPLLASAWERARLPDADAVVVSSSGWAHGVGTAPGCAKIVYCHNPARWLYQPQDYFPSRAAQRAFNVVRPWLTRWDQRAALTADVYIANSTAVARRIRDVYGIRADVVHPPVAIDVDGPQHPVESVEPGYWLAVARGRGYKNVDVVIEAVCGMPGHRLVVVGSPPPGTPTHARIRWVGVVTDSELRWLYANSRALVSVSREDFGLTPLESNAFGRPVAVLRAGGFLDSLDEGVSGVFVESPTPEAVAAALGAFPDFSPEVVRRHASRFDEAAFSRRIHAIVQQTIESTVTQPR